MDKFKVIKEYPSYYLCEHEKYKYKECFNKFDYKPDEEDYITKVETDLRRVGKIPIPADLEQSFNKFFKVGV